MHKKINANDSSAIKLKIFYTTHMSQQKTDINLLFV